MKKPPGILLLFILGMGGVMIAAALGVWIMVALSRHKLKSYKAELERHGEIFDPRQLIPAPSAKKSKNENDLIAACTELNDIVESKSIRPFAIGSFENTTGTAKIAHRLPSISQSTTNVSWDKFEATMELLRSSLTKIRQAAKPAELKIQPDYSLGFSNYTSFLKSALNAGQFLKGETILMLRHGNTAAAVEDVETILKLGELTTRQPVFISRRISIALIHIAAASTWEILQTGAPAGDLEKLQTAWIRINPLDGLSTTLRVERASTVDAFSEPPDDLLKLMRPYHHTSSVPPNAFQKAGKTAILETWSVFFRYGDELEIISDYQSVLDSLSTHKKWKDILSQLKTLEASTMSAGIGRAFGRISLFDANLFVRNSLGAEFLKKLVVTSIAIRRYELDHNGQPPDSLAMLVPTYLDAVPVDPMNNQPIRYIRTSDGFLLYAIGENGVDDGGNPASQPGRYSNFITDGLDIVWPRAIPPVTPAPGGSVPDKPRE